MFNACAWTQQFKVTFSDGSNGSSGNNDVVLHFSSLVQRFVEI
jgi:hypothetical protein